MRTPDDLADTPFWFRALLGISLLSGAGSGVVGLTQTDDRFRGADFNREIAARDARIRAVEVKLNAHLEHSAKYTERIDADHRELRDLEEAVEMLIRERR